MEGVFGSGGGEYHTHIENEKLQLKFKVVIFKVESGNVNRPRFDENAVTFK